MENEINEPTPKYNYVSAREYLAAEREATEKHELHNGHIIKMQGASNDHNRIVRNLIGNIHPVIKEQSCEVFPSDLRVYIPSAESFTYPDVSIVCDELQLLDDEYEDTQLNPTVIIEVMSSSSEKYDKGNKFLYYIQIDSLKEYILIDSTKCYMKVARKDAGGTWGFVETVDINAVLHIQSIDYSIALKDIYGRTKIV
jgi:Uma2 family endonuclease